MDRTWGLSFEDDHRSVNLTGPEEVITAPGRAPIRQGYLCLRSFLVVGKHEDTLVVLRAGARLSSYLPVAYDPTEAELWYPAKKACLRDNPAPPPQLAAELALRHGCS